MIRRLCFLTAGALLLPSAAQASEDNQLWTTANVSVALSDKLKASNELVLRFSDDRNGLYEVENTALLAYSLSKSVAIGAGYVHNPQYAGGDFTVMERRAREQITVDNFAKIGAAKVSGRMRVEQRWRGDESAAWRARPFVRVSVPIADKTTLLLSNETFLNLNRRSFQSVTGLDRMRNQIAVQRKIGKRVNLDVGYLNQHRFVRRGEDSSDHALTIGLGLSL